MRERAADQLQMMAAVHSAIASCLDKEGGAHFRSEAKRLESIIDPPTPQDTRAGLRKLVEQLGRFGARKAKLK